MASDTHKHCKECGEFKELNEFPKNSKGFLGRYSQCKFCWNSYVNQRNLRSDVKSKRKILDSTPERIASVRRAFVKRKYGDGGISLEARRLNGDPCDVCGGWTERMSIDHNHVTGKARGLLCRDCNLILGYVQDDPKRLLALIEYLENGGEVI